MICVFVFFVVFFFIEMMGWMFGLVIGSFLYVVGGCFLVFIGDDVCVRDGLCSFICLFW